MSYHGHPDFDAPEFHLADKPFPRAGYWQRPVSKDELRRLEEALAEIVRAQRAKEA